MSSTDREAAALMGVHIGSEASIRRTTGVLIIGA